jgi:hypothetical protein
MALSSQGSRNVSLLGIMARVSQLGTYQEDNLMALALPNDELEHAYDRLASYAKVLKGIAIEFSKWKQDEVLQQDILGVINDQLHKEGVTIDDVDIDSYVGRFRIVHQGPEGTG